MSVHAALLKELMIAGYEGAPLLAAFDRVCAALARHGIAAPVAAVAAAPVAVAPMVKPVKAARVRERDRRQSEMMLASDGGMAKTAPLSDAERQARRRERLKTVTLVTRDGAQAIDFVDESRNVTKSGVTQRDADGQAIEIVQDFGAGRRKRRRDGVTAGKKEFPPHPPMKKHNPLSPPVAGNVTAIEVHADDPLFAQLEAIRAKPVPRNSRGGWYFTANEIAAARRRVSAVADPPLSATG